MPERSSLAQGVQVGVEVTPGTNVAANKKLVSIGIEPAVSMDPQVYRPMGQKYPSLVVPGKEWVEADIEGAASYTEMMYIFASCLASPPAPTVIDISAQKHDFLPSSTAEDTVKTLSVEQGGSVRAHKFSYGLVTEVEIALTRDSAEISGSMIGQRISDNITMTAAPTGIPEKPILPTDLDVFMDTTSAGLGTTKLTRVLEATITLGDRFNPVWVLNSAVPSFVAHVESEPSAEITLLAEADAEGMAFLPLMRAGTTRFIRVKGTSPDLAGNTVEKFSFTWDAAAKISDVGDFDDADGVYAIEVTYAMTHDVTWGKAMAVSLVNKQTAL